MPSEVTPKPVRDSVDVRSQLADAGPVVQAGKREVPVRFDLAVFAAEPGADEASVRELIERCYANRHHVEGELDERIVGVLRSPPVDLS